MIIGITGLGGSGKSSASEYLKDIWGGTKVIHVDKLHVKVLKENPKIPLDIYGDEILKDGKWNSDLFIEYPDKLAKTFENSYELLVKAIKKEIDESKDYSYIIIDFFALPKIKEIFEICDVKILIKSSNEEGRINNIIKRRIKDGKVPEVNMEKRDAFAPDYDLYKYDYTIVNNYDENYYYDIEKVANNFKEEI